MTQDYKLGIRMLAKYPGLTLAGGLALALAIGIGAGWYELTRDFIRPTLPLAEGERIVEIDLRNSKTSEDERRILHDFVTWRRDLRSIVDLGAYRTMERNLILGDARPEPVTVAEVTASAFTLTRVPPLLGRPLLEADEQPGAPPVVVLGFLVWQQRFASRPDIVGRTLQLGSVTSTIVGVMPEGYAFPVNHRIWVPLPIRATGYAPLEGGAVRVFGRLARGATAEKAVAELTTLNANAAAASPQTHEQLRPRVRSYGSEVPNDNVLEMAMTHIPVLLVLIVACTNVGTLIYARTATRDAEIAMRYALGASRGRIVSQLFVEALVLSSVAAVAGLAVAHFALSWGVPAVYTAGSSGGLPFWMSPGISISTVVYAMILAVVGAAILGVLPALKATRQHAQSQLRNLGSGGATLRFGRLWTTAMIAQVALTVICIPAAMDVTAEAFRDRVTRSRFPAAQYLTARIELDREGEPTADADKAFAERVTRIYGELERRVRQEPGVVAVTFADILPGMEQGVRRAQIEVSTGAAPNTVGNLRVASVGPEFFEAFDRPIVSGRGFHDGDRAAGSRTVVVSEAFARSYFNGASPIGHRVRYATAATADGDTPEPWYEIVGMSRDVGMTPTDFGEAPFMFHPALPGAAYPPTMAVRVNGDSAPLAQKLRRIAAQLDPQLRLYDVRPLDDVAWRVDIPQVVVAGSLVAIVGLGLFLSAAGIFALLSVSIARRQREIGLRAALGASPRQLLGGIVMRAVGLVGSGILLGDFILLAAVALAAQFGAATRGLVMAVAVSLPPTSAIMLAAGLLACVAPARRALRIQPTDALKQT